MIKRAVVPIHSKSVERRYQAMMKINSWILTWRLDCSSPFCFLRPVVWGWQPQGKGVGAAPAHLLSYSWSLTPTPTSWQRGRIGRESRGTVLLWSLALCTLTIADACRSPFPRFPSLRSPSCNPHWQPFPMGLPLESPLSWLVLLCNIWQGYSAPLLSDVAHS